MKKLPLYTAPTVAELSHPAQQPDISEDSPALTVFTDFHRVNPLVVDATLSAMEVEELMLKSHVRLKFVVDRNRHFLGVVSLDDLNRQAMMQKLTEGYDRDSLSVKEFMQPRDQLKAFSCDDLSNATIRDVIATLKDSGQQHCLVIDRQSNDIRGIISASDIARKLRLPINIARRSNFSEIFRAVYH